MNTKDKCKYADTCTACCEQYIRDTQGCEFYNLREYIDNIMVEVKKYIKEIPDNSKLKIMVRAYDNRMNKPSRRQNLEEMIKESQELGLYDFNEEERDPEAVKYANLKNKVRSMELLAKSVNANFKLFEKLFEELSEELSEN